MSPVVYEYDSTYFHQKGKTDKDIELGNGKLEIRAADTPITIINGGVVIATLTKDYQKIEIATDKSEFLTAQLIP